MNFLMKADPEIAEAMRLEIERQKRNIILIASENFASKAVMEATGSVMTNKYAENYPGKRYYGGCEYVDIAENLAIDRAKTLFGAGHANVQPHSGAQANMAAYFTFIKPGDTIMGMRLDHGGHLTHGSPVNFSSKLYNIVSYGVHPETEVIDYDEAERIAKESNPKIIVVGASAYPRTIDFARFRAIADSIGAKLMVDMAHIAGLVAAGVHPSPVGHAQVITSTTHKTLRGPRGGMILCDAEFGEDIDKAVFPNMQGGPLMHAVAAKAVAFREAMTPEFAAYSRQVVENSKAIADEFATGGIRIVSGGTDNHLMLLDMESLRMSGRKAEVALGEVYITVNRNTIPNDKRKPWIASGVRIGTPSITSRGFNTEDSRQVARLIIKTLQNIDNEAVKQQVRDEVVALTARFPVPGIDE